MFIIMTFSVYNKAKSGYLNELKQPDTSKMSASLFWIEHPALQTKDKVIKQQY